jgi:hypothetical protein
LRGELRRELRRLRREEKEREGGLKDKRGRRKD